MRWGRLKKACVRSRHFIMSGHDKTIAGPAKVATGMKIHPRSRVLAQGQPPAKSPGQSAAAITESALKRDCPTTIEGKSIAAAEINRRKQKKWLFSQSDT